MKQILIDKGIKTLNEYIPKSFLKDCEGCVRLFISDDLPLTCLYLFNGEGVLLNPLTGEFIFVIEDDENYILEFDKSFDEYSIHWCREYLRVYLLIKSHFPKEGRLKEFENFLRNIFFIDELKGSNTKVNQLIEMKDTDFDLWVKILRGNTSLDKSKINRLAEKYPYLKLKRILFNMK